MVYQDPGTALNPSIKVGEQIAEVYRFHKGMGRSEALAAAVEMLSTVQISAPDRVVRRYPHELSGGQQQRIMFAMALATDPDLLVLDEPTTGLDATVEAEVLDLVEQLRTQFDTSILFVSHNLGIVGPNVRAGRGALRRRLIEEGPATELFQTPGTRTRSRSCAACRDWGCARTSTGSTRSPARCRRSASRSPAACTPTAARSRATAAGRSLRRSSRWRPATARRCFYHEEVPAHPAPRAGPRRRRRSAEAAERRPSEGGRSGQGVRIRREPGGRGRRRRHRGRPRRGARPGRRVRAAARRRSPSASSGCSTPAPARSSSTRSDVTKSGRDREARRQLQMVFQNPDNALNPSHTVRRDPAALARASRRRAGQGQQDRGDGRPGARRCGSSRAISTSGRRRSRAA